MPSEMRCEEETSVRNQYIAAIVANIMVISHGCSIGWPSPLIPYLSGKDTPLDEPLTSDEASWVGSLMCIGAIFGTPVYGWVSDRFGRKKAIMLSAIPYFISWLLKLTWRTSLGIMLGRFFAGLGGSGVFMIAPTYGVEIASLKVRGVLGTLMILCLNGGILVMYIIGAYLSYNAVQWCMVCVPALSILLMSKMPETPVFLVKNNREQEAAKAIAWLRRMPVNSSSVHKAVMALKYEVQLAKSSNNNIETIKDTSDEKITTREEKTQEIPSWKFLILSKPTLKAFTLCFSILTVQVFTGVFAILTYANLIFEQAGSHMSPNVNSIIVGLLQIFGSLLGSFLVEKCGRKILLLISSAVAGSSNITIGAYLLVKANGYDVSSVGWIPVTALSFFVFMFSMGLGPIPFVLPSEMIMVQARAIATTIILLWVWSTTFFLARFFNVVAELIGLYVAFFTFGTISFLGILIITIFMPETKDKPFESIMAYFNGGKVESKKEEQLL